MSFQNLKPGDKVRYRSEILARAHERRHQAYFEDSRGRKFQARVGRVMEDLIYDRYVCVEPPRGGSVQGVHNPCVVDARNFIEVVP